MLRVLRGLGHLVRLTVIHWLSHWRESVQRAALGVVLGRMNGRGRIRLWRLVAGDGRILLPAHGRLGGHAVVWFYKTRQKRFKECLRAWTSEASGEALLHAEQAKKNEHGGGLPEDA